LCLFVIVCNRNENVAKTNHQWGCNPPSSTSNPPASNNENTIYPTQPCKNTQ